MPRKCNDCGDFHSDWRHVGSNDSMAFSEELFECGHCGNVQGGGGWH